jgi:C-terminal processing protease CtpA/Prc
MRDRKVFVLDIRGNRGGDDDYVLQWVRNYTGNANLKQLTTGSEIDQLDSKAGGYLFAKTLQNLPKMSEMAQRIATSSMEIYQDGANTWSLTRFSPAEQTENPNVIFVLVDKGVASSGEEIIPELETMKNVVIVGTNSSGCMLSNAEVQIVLPNSKLSVQCGNWLNLYNSKFFAEGTGFLPDIWDAGDDALSRLVAMIKYYRAR